MTVLPLTLTPAATAPGVGAYAEPTGDQLAVFHPVTARDQVALRTAQPDYHQWLHHVRAAAACTRPIRLAGNLYTLRGTDDGGAHILDQTATETMPDGAIYKACGNRRASVCPACARTYQADAYQLIRAGLIGGKGVPATVARHPSVFATFTAPSFGTVHTRPVPKHTCVNRRRCDCRPDPCHARRAAGTPGLCEHGNPAVCWARHELADAVLGRPLCPDCYHHEQQVVWNLYAGELWRRTTIAVTRHLAALCRQRGIASVAVLTASGKVRRVPPVRVSHGKVAEMQARAAVHFHALLRLDGIHPADPDAVVAPPAGITTADLHDAITHAAATVAFTTPAHPDQPGGWPITWGEQLDIRPVALTGRGEITDSMVAGYLAKYATKSTEVTGHRSTRLTAETIDTYAGPDGEHTARLIDACWRLGRPTHTPRPLADRPRRPTSARHLGPRWTCPDCAAPTRLVVCPNCTPQRQPEVDTKPANTGRPNPYARLRRWAHMLGFGGHFLTKARRYSITFRVLRQARIVYRRAESTGPEQPIRTAEHLAEETTLVVGVLTFAGVGWHNTGDAILANTAASMARERQRIAREEIAHEIGTALLVGARTVAA